VTEWIWVGERDARAIHGLALAQHGGAVGVRDEGLLLSTLATPQQILSCGETTDLITLAGAYTVGIVKNHPFVDGNKRTGFILGILFLELNGGRFVANEEDAAAAVLALAAGAWRDDAYADFLRQNDLC
jgi:death-on-curing protein